MTMVYSLYQIYGTHQIFRSNTLLYIGKSGEQLFSKRIKQHNKWLEKEYDQG